MSDFCDGLHQKALISAIAGSLGSFCSTIELHPQTVEKSAHADQGLRLVYRVVYTDPRNASGNCHSCMTLVNVCFANAGDLLRGPAHDPGNLIVGHTSRDHPSAIGPSQVVDVFRSTFAADFINVADSCSISNLSYSRGRADRFGPAVGRA